MMLGKGSIGTSKFPRDQINLTQHQQASLPLSKSVIKDAGRLLAGTLLLLVAACTSVTRSDLFYAGNEETHCTSQLGEYVLPKTVIRIKVQGQTFGETRYNVLTDLEKKIVPHNDIRYCLEYKSNSFSHDKVNIATSKNQFLAFISSDSADQTAYILKTLIRTAFIGITNDQGFRATGIPADAVDLVDLRFDPFDINETAAKNVELVKLGFCVVLNGFTFGPYDDVQSYCSNPGKYLKRETKYSKSYQRILNTTIIPQSGGVLYRPRVSYKLSVYSKGDVDAPGQWHPRQSKMFEMENISPFIALKIDRSIFAVRRVGFVFQQGELRNACLFKSAQAVEAITVPLEIVKSIVALPTSILMVRLDNVTNAGKLAAVENRLLQAQINYLTLLNNPNLSAKSSGSDQSLSKLTINDQLGFERLQFDDAKQTNFWEDICKDPRNKGAPTALLTE